MVTKTELVKALSFVQKGVAIKELIQQSACFVFEKGRVYSYNDEISISHPIDFPYQGAVRAAEFFELINKMPEGEIEFTLMKDGNELRLKSGKSRAGMLFQSKILLPYNAAEYQGDVVKAPEGLIEAIKFVSVACVRDVTKPKLMCVNVTPNRAEASDAFRIITKEYANSEKGEFPAFMVPAHNLTALFPYANDIAKVVIDSEWAHFITKEDAVFSCRTFSQDKFPEVDKYLIIKGEEIMLPKVVAECVGRASVFSLAKSKDTLAIPKITLHFEKGLLRISSRSSSGWFKEEMEIGYEGEEKTCLIHPEVFQQVTQLSQQCVLGLGSVLFKGNNWQYVVALQE